MEATAVLNVSRGVKLLKFLREDTCMHFPSCGSCILVELEFGDVGFCGEKKTGEPGGHSIRFLNERSVSDGGNLRPLWLVILKSV